jgi:hypothetical protein
MPRRSGSFWAVLASVCLVGAELPSTKTTELHIITVPDGAEVWNDTIHLGVTTENGLKVAGLESGPITITIMREGYETATRTIEISPSGEPVTILVRLQLAAESVAELYWFSVKMTATVFL